MRAAGVTTACRTQSFRLSSIAARRALLLERGFRQIVAALDDVIVVTDADGRVAWTNESDDDERLLKTSSTLHRSSLRLRLLLLLAYVGVCPPPHAAC